MAFAATKSTSEPRSFSIGPVKVQIFTYTAASADTSGTVTADKLSNITHILMDASLVLTSAATFSGNVATLAFADPAATVFGTLICFGN